MNFLFTIPSQVHMTVIYLPSVTILTAQTAIQFVLTSIVILINFQIRSFPYSPSYTSLLCFVHTISHVPQCQWLNDVNKKRIKFSTVGGPPTYMFLVAKNNHVRLTQIMHSLTHFQSFPPWRWVCQQVPGQPIFLHCVPDIGGTSS